MEQGSDGLEQVRSILRLSRKGMTIGNVSDRLKISRNSAAKYLDMLLMAGEVDVHTFGRSKIYRLTDRIPVQTVPGLSSDMIIFIDEDLELIGANDRFLHFTGLEQWQIEGRPLEEIDDEIISHRNIMLNLRDALRGREFQQEIRVSRVTGEHYFSVRIVPVAPRADRRCVAIVYQDITVRKKAEIALKESEARYRAVVESQTEQICRILPDTTITFVNDACCRYWSASREQLIGRKLVDLLAPNAGARMLDDLHRRRESGEGVSKNLNGDGSSRWLRWAYRAIFDERRQLTEYQLVARDITEMKRTMDALQLTQLSVDNATVGVVWLDREGRILYANRAICLLLGYSPDEFKRLNIFEINPAYADRERWQQRLDSVRHGGSLKYESESRRKDGTIIQVEAYLHSAVVDNDEILFYYIMEVTDKKRSEALDLFGRLALEEAAEAIGCLSTDGRYVQANPALCRVLDYSRDELLAKTVFDAGPAIRTAEWALRLEAIRTSGPYREKITCLARGGRQFTAEVSLDVFTAGSRDYVCMFICPA